MRTENIICYVLTAVFLLTPLRSFAADHVLIMTISEYPTKPLDGVKHDAANAVRLAKKLGFDTTNVVMVKDKQLSGNGIFAAMQALQKRIKPDDRVFVYYSGHGASALNNGICVQSLVTQDEKLFDTELIRNWADATRRKASSVLLVIDACHSGGLGEISVLRGSGKSHDPKYGTEKRLAAKAWVPKDAKECAVASNLAKSWATRSMTDLASNLTLIAAANEREVALDDPDSGGLATSSLLECANHGVTDQDGSGRISMEELRACAQRSLNSRIKSGYDRYKPHHIEIYGNSEIYLPLVTVPPQVAVEPADAVLASFRQMQANSSALSGLKVTVSATEVRLGESVKLRYEMAMPSYAYLLYVGSDRKDMRQIWPNPGEHRLRQAGNLTLPITAPAGENLFLIVASSSALDLSTVFSGGATATISPATLASLGCVAMQKRNVGVVIEDGDCASDKRNVGVVSEDPLPSDSAMAARLFSVRGR